MFYIIYITYYILFIMYHMSNNTYLYIIIMDNVLYTIYCIFFIILYIT